MAGVGLGHEGGVHVVAKGHFLHHEPVGHGVVRHGHGVGVPQGDLALAGTALVVAELDADADLLEGHHGIASQVGCPVQRGEIEIAALVEGLGRTFAGLEVVVFEFGLDVEGVSVPGGALEAPLEDLARVALVGLGAVGVQDVAEHAAHGAFPGVRTPGQYLEGAGVRHGDHVLLAVPDEPLDGRAVEDLAVLQGVFQFFHRDGETLQETQYIREPQLDDLDVVFLGRVEDVILRRIRCVAHASPVRDAGLATWTASPFSFSSYRGSRPCASAPCGTAVSGVPSDVRAYPLPGACPARRPGRSKGGSRRPGSGGSAASLYDVDPLRLSLIAPAKTIIQSKPGRRSGQSVSRARNAP